LVFLTIGAAALGNIRFVSGAPGGIVKRQYFGFSDMFASVADCTSQPWIVASATHGPLCSDLQAAGVLESDAAREARIRGDFNAEMERSQRQVQQQMEEFNRELRRQMNQ
jgi:hypothetical protein